MRYEFFAYGHPNIKGMHKTTLEFTKDKEITLRGDCIIGVNADFNPEKLKEFIKKVKDKIRITLKADGMQETITGQACNIFNSRTEIVIRKTDFVSQRTLAIKANKAAFDIKRNFIAYLKNKEHKITIYIEEEH